ncbi:UDP-GlcNAc:undecaprenyl-phosphate/decaprenyl-phosphate GlcNAc-1-phosphate transferase [Gammaproteobacteria bacterium]|nr:undecaprenyl/decaprenyl-phosphate alpha-N-acetylglucosaminyl 1-phosphate transferase [Gammaproteobacteria bacterium]CAG0939178.1 UDP-GlcNAc:undecaprenyl-phosphate/decaprenyl-phosphate GlcNAc-1-phosphate transferase [Gammaproteobacteria bacterium]
MTDLLASALGCALTAALIFVLRPVAMSVGLVDVPDARKSHQGPIPLVGGLAIFASVLAASLVPGLTGLSIAAPEDLSFVVAGLILVGVGLVDDFIELSPASRFLAQALATLAMVYGARVVLADLGAMTPSGAMLELGLAAMPFTLFATVGVINALNMCDGLDGLSGSQALVSLAGFGLALVLWGPDGNAGLLMVMAGGIVGFLLFNLRLPGRARASIFLGDAGSMFLGFALTWFAISLSQGPDRVIKPAAALWFIMVPVMDAVAMMLRRVVRGRSPFSPDREHLHHIFLLAGFSVNQTVAIMALLGAAGVAVGLLGTWLGVPDLLLAGAFLVAGMLYFWMIMHSWRVMRFLRRSICRRRSLMADRRSNVDRRQSAGHGYAGPERRSGVERRQALPRRAGDMERNRACLPPQRKLPESRLPQEAAAARLGSLHGSGVG